MFFWDRYKIEMAHGVDRGALRQKGYPSAVIEKWNELVNSDYEKYRDDIKPRKIYKAHRAGLAGDEIGKYLDNPKIFASNLSTLDNMMLGDVNNSFRLWVQRRLVTERILGNRGDILPKIHYSIVPRNGAIMILRCDSFDDRIASWSDIKETLKQRRSLMLRSASWNSDIKAIEIYMRDNGDVVWNGRCCSDEEMEENFKQLTYDHVITDTIPNKDILHIDPRQKEHFIDIYIGNDFGYKQEVLQTEINMKLSLDEGIVWFKAPVKKDGSAEIYREGKESIKLTIPHWKEIIYRCKQLSKDLSLVSLLQVRITLIKERPYFIITDFFDQYSERRQDNNEKLNRFLKASISSRLEYNKLPGMLDYIDEEQRRKKPLSDQAERFARPGMRPHMYGVWLDQMEEDRLNTKHITDEEKQWAWDRGFLSDKISEYNLTEENYKEFVSDYDYNWINRINNEYRKLIDDKTTFRYSMQAFDDYLPRCYYLIKYNSLTRLIDCPEVFGETMNDLFRLLRKEKALVMKPSAGSGGDGFFLLQSEGKKYFVNGQERSKAEIKALISELKVFYVVTEYLEPSDYLKSFYDKALSTFRIITRCSSNGEIHTMVGKFRIGCSKSGYVDNTSAGGLSVLFDTQTGEMKQALQTVDNIYEPITHHPDSGKKIFFWGGQLPDWEEIITLVHKMATYIAEVEYLGFDVALTQKGIKIIEINIHPAVKSTDCVGEMERFLKYKIKQKAELYGLDEEKFLGPAFEKYDKPRNEETEK